jgi:hypothetical protein
MSLWRQRLMLQLPISTIWCMMAANTTSFCHSSTTAVLDRMRGQCKRDDPGSVSVKTKRASRTRFLLQYSPGRSCYCSDRKFFLNLYDVDYSASLLGRDLDGSFPDCKRVAVPKRCTRSKLQQAGRLYLLNVPS